MEKRRRNCMPILYRKDVLELLWDEVLMQEMKKYFSLVLVSGTSSADTDRFPLVQYD